MRFRIRKSTAADTARLFEVWRTSVAATHDFVSDDDLAAIADLVRDEYLPRADLDVVVDENDNPIAFMGMTANEIDTLFVHEDARGTGLGRMLVELALNRGLVIRTEVNEQNNQAIAFWKHMEFHRMGRSALDRQGRAYPLLKLEWSARE